MIHGNLSENVENSKFLDINLTWGIKISYVSSFLNKFMLYINIFYYYSLQKNVSRKNFINGVSVFSNIISLFWNTI